MSVKTQKIMGWLVSLLVVGYFVLGYIRRGLADFGKERFIYDYLTFVFAVLGISYVFIYIKNKKEKD